MQSQEEKTNSAQGLVRIADILKRHRANIVSETEQGLLICGDCLEILPQIPDGAVDAVITDPPYGIDLHLNSNRGRGKAIRFDAAVIGDASQFNPRHLLRFFDKPMFLCGGNFFLRELPSADGWIVWDKRVDLPSDDHSDAELIWHNVDSRITMFRHRWRGFVKDGEKVEKYHPTQKPIELARWIISRWTKPDDLILDCYAGSGSILVAAKQLGRRYIGIEIEPKYCKIAEDRLRQEILL